MLLCTVFVVKWKSKVSVNHVLFAFEFETRKKGKIRKTVTRKMCKQKKSKSTQQINVHAH